LGVLHRLLLLTSVSNCCKVEDGRLRRTELLPPAPLSQSELVIGKGTEMAENVVGVGVVGVGVVEEEAGESLLPFQGRGVNILSGAPIFACVPTDLWTWTPPPGLRPPTSMSDESVLLMLLLAPPPCSCLL
jgi:hypothetical protein